MVFNGILKLMPSLARTVNYQQLTINRKSRGFTLIELLVVITLFAITSSLITASYITFEKNQRIRNAAQTLKNDLRFTQNKSLAGDKGVSNVSSSDCTDTIGTSQCCPNHLGSDDYYLVGWAVTFDPAQTSSYTFVGICKNKTNNAESSFGSKTVTYPSGVTLNNNAPNTGIKIGGSIQNSTVKVLFRPLNTSISLHTNSAPPFTNASGVLINTAPSAGDLTIELMGEQTSNLNIVTVRTTGEISGN